MFILDNAIPHVIAAVAFMTLVMNMTKSYQAPGALKLIFILIKPNSNLIYLKNSNTKIGDTSFISSKDHAKFPLSSRPFQDPWFENHSEGNWELKVFPGKWRKIFSFCACLQIETETKDVVCL